MKSAGLFVLAGLVLGTWLRVTQLGAQVLWMDELLSVRAASRYDFWGILTHFGRSDHSIPLTLLTKLLGQTVGLSELTQLMPPLIFGIASIVVFSAIVRDVFGPLTGRIFLWLMAISPLHVSLSRHARPFTISLFFTVLAVWSFFRFRESGKKHFAWAYVFSAILAPYFHLSALLPSILPSLSNKFRLKPFIFVLGGLTLLLLPPLWNDFASIAMKAQQSTVNWITFVDGLSLLIGADLSRPVSWVLLGLALIGMKVGFTRSKFTSYLSILTLLQILFSIFSAPLDIDIPIVFARYNLIALPVFLIFIALGIETCALTASGLFSPRGIAAPAALATILILVSAAQLMPLRSTFLETNSWVNWDIWHRLAARWPEREPGTPKFLKNDSVPGFYGNLGQKPHGSENLVEVPWYRARPTPHYERQQIHRQPVLLGLVNPVSSGELVDIGPVEYSEELNRVLKGFKNFVLVSDFEELKRKNVKYVVFHKDLSNEIRPEMLVPGSERISVDKEVETYKAKFGNPAYESAELVIFGLEPER